MLYPHPDDCTQHARRGAAHAYLGAFLVLPGGRYFPENKAVLLHQYKRSTSNAKFVVPRSSTTTSRAFRLNALAPHCVSLYGRLNKVRTVMLKTRLASLRKKLCFLMITSLSIQREPITPSASPTSPMSLPVSSAEVAPSAST